MKAILRKALADLRRRKVQTAVVMLVVLLSSLAATMALTLLVESDAPFDHAFAQAQGAHLTMSFDASRVTQDQLRATGSITGVTADAGPWPVSPWAADMGGGLTQLVPLEGRSGPGGPVDRLTLNAGRWAHAADEVVLAQDFADKSGHQIGDHIQAQSGSLFPAMTVVGIAAGVGDNPAGWTIPTNFPVVTTGKIPTMYDMAYRLHQAGTASQINAVANAITAELPSGAVVDSNNYLDAKLNADRTTAVMIPFLLAFSGFALLASALIIANLVSGAVIAGTRDIGVMKSVGYTPWQVVLVFAGQMLGPAVIGSVFGLVGGIVASQPFLSDTARAFNLPRTFGVAPLPDALGIGTILAVVALTTLLASWRAGRLSAASAIATGSAPASARAYRVTRLVSRFPVPRSWSLGAGESFARPVRSAMTLVAIVIGVATITFALGLTRSLSDVKAGITRDQAVQVTIYHHGNPGGKGGPAASGITDQQLAAAIAANRQTAHYVAEYQTQVSMTGVAHPVDLTAYNGNSSWVGYPIIQGRWFSAAGDAVAPTAFYTQTGHHLGDHITVTLNGQPITLTLVGEIFDVEGDGVLLRTSFSSLPYGPEPNRYEIQLRPGADPNGYAGSFMQLDQSIDAQTAREQGTDTAFLLINSTLAGLALILTLIALAGVFNTVVLNTREKARDFAVLKAVGMAPGQVVTMVLTSVVVLGGIAAVIGIPAGMLLHRNILVLMGQIASSTNVPSQYFSVFEPAVLIMLAAGAIAIAMLGAFIPGQWAARLPITQVLQTE